MLKIRNLFVKYLDSEKPSIEDISFDVEKGDQIAILGPSGCGKSTLLHVISGLLTEREAKIDGILDWRTSKQKPVMRMVFQEATLLSWRTVEKNIAFGLEVNKVSKDDIEKKVKEILEIVGLSQHAKSYPFQLSVGMQQRVNFARALVCEPELLLLDEPFSALDVETKKNLQEEFLKIIKAKGITSIFVTHNVGEAVSMSNKIIILTAGPAKVKEISINGLKLEKELISHYIDMHELE